MKSSRRALSAAAATLAITGCRSVAAIGVASLALALSGCYSYVPRPAATMTPGRNVQVDISDLGRVALTERAGAEISRITGTVRNQSDSGMTILVSEVAYLNGQVNRWQGQEVLLRSQDMKAVSERVFSRKRTILLAVAAGVAVAIAVTQTGLKGIFTGGGQDKNPNPNPNPES